MGAEAFYGRCMCDGHMHVCLELARALGARSRYAARGQHGAVAERSGIPIAGLRGGSSRAAAVAKRKEHGGRQREHVVVHAAAPALLLEGCVLQ